MSLSSALHTLPALRGGLLALLAAVLVGISTPLVQQFGAGLGASSTAALSAGHRPCISLRIFVRRLLSTKAWAMSSKLLLTRITPALCGASLYYWFSY